MSLYARGRSQLDPKRVPENSLGWPSTSPCLAAVLSRIAPLRYSIPVLKPTAIPVLPHQQAAASTPSRNHRLPSPRLERSRIVASSQVIFHQSPTEISTTAEAHALTTTSTNCASRHCILISPDIS